MKFFYQLIDGLLRDALGKVIVEISRFGELLWWVKLDGGSIKFDLEETADGSEINWDEYWDVEL